MSFWTWIFVWYMLDWLCSACTACDNLCSGYNHMPQTPTCVSCIILVLTSEGTIAYHPLPSPFTRIREDERYIFEGPYYGYHFISLIVGENMFNCTMCILTAALDVHHWKSSWLLGSKKKKQYSEQESSNNSHCCKMQARVPECELFILAFISLLRNWWNY